MNDLLIAALVTFPAYAYPLFQSFKRQGLVATSFFFAYTMIGNWLFGLLLATGGLNEDAVIADWVISSDQIPWYSMALINLVIYFFSQRNSKCRRHDYRGISVKNFTRFTVITLIVAALYVGSSILLFGGFGAWLAVSYSRAAVDSSVFNYLSPLSVFTSVSTVILYAGIRRYKIRPMIKIMVYGACGLQLFIALASGGRSVLLLYIISLVVAHGKGNIPRVIKYSVMGVMVVAISGIMIYNRYSEQGAQAQFDLSVNNVAGAAYTGLPFIDHFQLSRKYAEDVGNDYGANYVSLLALPIPRELWPGKPTQLSRELRWQFWGDTTGGIPPGFFGEAYISFGWIGVVIAAILFGAGLAKLSRTYPLNDGSAYEIAVMAVVGSAVGFVLIRGGLDIGVYRVGLILFSLWIVLSKVFVSPVARRRRRGRVEWQVA